MSSGLESGASLRNPSSWTQWHMIDSSWEGGAIDLSSELGEEEPSSSFSMIPLRHTYLVSRLPTYFGNVQNVLPPKRVVFYLWQVQEKCFAPNFWQLYQSALSFRGLSPQTSAWNFKSLLNDSLKSLLPAHHCALKSYGLFIGPFMPQGWLNLIYLLCGFLIVSAIFVWLQFSKFVIS